MPSTEQSTVDCRCDLCGSELNSSESNGKLFIERCDCLDEYLREEGNTLGYEAGYSEGIESVAPSPYEEEVAYTDGWAEGYSEGHSQGYEDGLQDSGNLINLIERKL